MVALLSGFIFKNIFYFVILFFKEPHWAWCGVQSQDSEIITPAEGRRLIDWAIWHSPSGFLSFPLAIPQYSSMCFLSSFPLPSRDYYEQYLLPETFAHSLNVCWTYICTVRVGELWYWARQTRATRSQCFWEMWSIKDLNLVGELPGKLPGGGVKISTKEAGVCVCMWKHGG